ncbi:RHS repeat-associated protein [Silvibacterium bohemicum]|uniref:RHS repeat-associated protein n=1 Tax=Silvibacterium bohemicum TaxID=1577686 RepID=A0A841K0G3_9BACT|nr:RHS repeat-associated core domain-containing protein [Silvibacterium bohemicum]MBB6144701.1 RHS repeat-associated protein [Silvibacterium bohemicum]
MRFLKALYVCLVAFGLFSVAHAQVTGIYEFGPFDTPGFDTINRGNLNVHFSIPIFSKPGRGGTNFVYALNYDGLVWSPRSSSGLPGWTPAPAWGWTDATNAEWGYLTYSVSLQSCTTPSVPHLNEFLSSYSNYVYHDNKGNSHAIPFAFVNTCGNTGSPTGTGTYALTDNSGLSIYRVNNSFTIFTKSGAEFSVPVYSSFNGYQEQISPGSGVYTDTNGNQISASSAGVFTDTMGKTALTVSGAAPSPVLYKYTDPNGNSQTVTVNYESYTVQTAFGVNGISEYSQSSIPLVSSIVYSGDGSSYSFTYEPTPGNPSAVTGRIASIKLRTGGTISYAYTGGTNNTGIESDGTIPTLTRTTSDGATTYTRSGISSTQSGTTSTDPYGNTTTSNFLVNSAGYFYEFDHAVYAGAASGTPLAEVTTCYNVATNCASSNVNSGFASIVTTGYQNGTAISVDTQNYTGPELLSSDGNASSTTTYNYNTYTGPNGIPFYRVASVIASSQGSNYQETTYGYDETAPTTFSGSPAPVAVSTQRGNVTSVHQWINSSGATLNTTNAYDTTGTLLSSTGPTGMTTFGHDSTGTFTTSVTPPTPSSGVTLTTSAQYDPNTGLLSSTTDPNGTQVRYSYTGMLDPLQVTNLDSSGNMVGETYYSHESINQIGVYNYQSASVRGGVEPLLDGYGRITRAALLNGQGANPYYQQDACYDADGRIAFQSYRYPGTGWGMPMVCSGAGDTYSYDALGRVTKVTHGDGTAVSYIYNANAVKTTDENGVSRIYQLDPLGRTTSVCEISANSTMPNSGSPVSCGATIPGTGFLTSYSYSLPNHTTTVTQGVQTRVFQTDWLGRTIMTQEPERGTTTYSYSYNSQGLVVTRARPAPNQASASTLLTTTFQYDSMGRLTEKSYSDDEGPIFYGYDIPQVVFEPVPANASLRVVVPLSNQAGRMAWTCHENSAQNGCLTQNAFSYDAMGRVLNKWTAGPGYMAAQAPVRAQIYTYDWLGNILTATNDNAVTLTTSYTVANEVSSITSSLNDATHPPNLVSSITNGPFGPVSFLLGNGLSGYNTYDSLGRLNGKWVCTGNNPQPACSASSMVNGFTMTWQGQQLKSSTDSVLPANGVYTYDDFNRLSLTNYVGSNYEFNEVYDRYGNRWQQNTVVGNGGEPQISFDSTTNRVNTGGYVTDAAGNVTYDGFHSYSFDADGNVLTIDNGQTETYTRDAFGHIARADFPANIATPIEFYWSPSGQLTTTWTPNVNQLIEGMYYWGGTEIGAYADNAMHFEHKDWVNTTRMTTSYNGSVEATFDSLPFGDGYTDHGASWDYYHFGGMMLDSLALTHLSQFRQYSGTQGRWLSPDPYSGSYDFTNPQSMNRYSYVLNNPLAFIDPSGLEVVDCPPGTDDGTICVDAPSSGDPDPGPEPDPPPPGPGIPSQQPSGGGTRPSAPNNGTTCPAVPFKITGVAPGQAPGTTAISQTPRGGIPNGGVAIKPGNFGVGGINGSNRSVFLGMTFTVNWSGTTVPSGIPTQGPFFPVDNIGPASVRNAPGNAFDVYNYPSFKQAFASTRTAMVTTYIPANTAGVRCPQ